MIWIWDILDIAKKHYVTEYYKGKVKIFYKGVKMDTSGEWEEYIVKRWIWKDEANRSIK